MKDLVNFYITNFAKVNANRTKEIIMKQLESIKKVSVSLQTIDFELAMIKILEIHLKFQTPIETEIYQAADVKLIHLDQRRWYSRF